MAVGNHEFDFGQDVATGYQDQTGFPVLSVNTVYADSQELVFEPSTNVAKVVKTLKNDKSVSSEIKNIIDEYDWD